MTTTEVRRGAGRLRLLPMLVLASLIAASLGVFVVSRRVVDDQEQHLLAERAAEVGALLSNSIDSAESSLAVLGPIGASPEPAAAALFTESAGRRIVGTTMTVGVAADDGGGFAVVAAVGDGPAVGEALAGQRSTLAGRALALKEPQLVADLIVDQGVTKLVLAMAVGGTRAVVYEESVLDPTRPVPAPPESPFHSLRAALYASPDADPDRLVFSTEADLPLSGRVELLPRPVGADRWLLVVGTRSPLVGSWAPNVSWLLLGGGLVLALLATAVVETLARRRAYALALVAERTGELEQTLDELRQTREFLDRLLTAGPILVLRLAMPGREISYVSPNVERLTGVSVEEARAPGFLLGRVHRDDVAGFNATLDRVADGSSTREAIEYRVVRADGSSRWVSAVLVPESDDDGSENIAAAVLAYIVDVDDRHRAEEAQRAAQEAADRANRSKSEFLSRMSHELRTPLNAVLGFGQLLEIDDLSVPQRDAVDHILKGGRHLLGLINEVLDISRIEAGELSLSPEPVLASEVIQDAVDLIRPLADQRGIQVVVDGSGVCDCYVFADRQRVQQVLLNLLSNAVKYNRPRGTVAISCEQFTDTRVRISVADTGLGVPAERLGMLFTPFERLGAEHTAEEGTGIGLALSRQLAEAMGGTLAAASTLGQGSTFTVELPRVEGPVERYERLNGGTHSMVEPAERRCVVLHIEDNLSNLTLVERILAQRAGVEVVAAMHGRLGLELAREHRPAIVLLDLHLPDMSGEQVLQRLREDPDTASIPVVIVSADATAGQVQRLLSAGASSYLTKPIDVRELLRLVDEVVDSA
jgi:PAS domain S-box-containing protein